MEHEQEAEKYARRRKKIIGYHVAVVLGYGCTQLAFLLARMFGLCTVEYRTIAMFAALVVGVPAFFLVILMTKKNLTSEFGIIVSYIEFAWWLAVYTVWVYLLNEMRLMGLFFAMMPLTFLLTSTSYFQTLYTATGAVVLQVCVTYYAIEVAGQSGNFFRDLFITLAFLPTAWYLAYLSRLFERQRNNIKKGKAIAEDALSRLWGEMDIAKKIQTVLLPRDPKIAGYRFYGHMNPADEIGGDYYDVVHCAGRDWLVIGDVSGHGVAAGLVMMMVQTSIHTVLDISEAEDTPLKPSDLITKINKTIYRNIQRMGDSKYMTINVLLLEKDGRVHHAGLHQDLLVYRADTGTVDTIETTGAWIGLLEHVDGMIHDNVFQLNVNDILFAYTDGITESRSKDDATSYYGEKKLEEVVQTHAGKSLEVFPNEVLKTFEDYKFADDATFVILKREV